ncbi:MAG TPA: prepilin-type N-terminal cleavage/methylation domain-containing protein [Polyangia bacterium]|jgi:prepilin-type N-terminal cleavage/methylation domain-containing protein|nr:prepilin-type N-terminal cleavage/methylation domain-containing protein [Polyangia bacterium]
MRRLAKRPRDAGFTLLEVMAALAILALTLVTLLSVITNNVRATARAQALTTATFLARGKIVSLEDGLIEKGFQDLDENDAGTFVDDGFPDFGWSTAIEKIQLPTDMAMSAQKAVGDQSTKKDPMQALTGMIGGLMGMFIEPVRVGLEESVRRITVRVFWTERGRPEQSVEVVTYVTDPAKLDLALSLGAAGAGAGNKSPSSSTSSKPSTGGTK